jgi:hypothetical protein
MKPVFSRSSLGVAVVVLAGASAVVLLVQRQRHPVADVGMGEESQGHPRGSPAALPNIPAEVQLDRARLQALERQVAALSAASAEPKATAPDPTLERPPSREMREARLREEVRSHQDLLLQHEHESRDSRWASSMEQELNAQFKALEADIEAQVARTDCRSTTCIADLNWPSRGEAEVELASIPAQVATSFPCLRRLVLPPEEPGSKFYQATLYLDCTPAADKK